ncbi:BTB domain-containing protein [Caenorhabditis elegans]|uniref:BTB domain-containing protein n=1 Tax=Caenorhabditis elegans TaxID=6239 RepID=P91564_CAEEL|nr:BTB domain-containing protein [Caenorhabditis elegans]CCD64939.1 BTB domain-containing protein [Caenorhabditis elegans]|eukprot:NP_494482.1 Uncharacterized protein CELE_ZC239.16 [Caenorhabditis elegans]
MSEIIKLDVGGTIFKTSKDTLTKFHSFFKTMLECKTGPKIEKTGCIFIDRSPKHFELILNLMRDGDLPLPEDERELRELMAEAQFYWLDGLVLMCCDKLNSTKKVQIDQRANTKKYDLSWFFVFSIIFLVLVFVYYMPALKGYFIVEKRNKCYLF